MQEVHLGHDPIVRRKSVMYLKKQLEIDYHQMDVVELYTRYGTDPMKVPNQGK